MLSLVATLLLTQCGPQGPIYSCPATMGEVDGVSFLFSLSPPASEECTCATSTNATILGGATSAVTVDRSSGAFCTKGITARTNVFDAGTFTSGYVLGISADAGMVFCAANKLRVMQGPTSGYGLLPEGSMLNYVYGSQNLDGTDWSVAGLNGASAPTVTANAGPGPDGTATAERFQFPATTGALASGGRALAFPAVANVPPPSVCNGQLTSCSLFAMNYSYVDGGQILGVASTGTDGPGGFRALRCPIASHTAYTECRLEGMNVTAGGGGSLVFGTLSYYDGTDYAAADVLVTKLQCECNDHSTSHFPTTVGAVATRARDAITASLPFVPSGSDLRLSATVANAVTVQPSRSVVSLEGTVSGGSGTDYFNLATSSGSKVECNKLVANVTETFEGPLYVASAANEAACAFNGAATLAACLGSTCDAGTATTAPTRAYVMGIGAKWSGADWIYQIQDVVKDVNVSSATRKVLIIAGDSIPAGTYVLTSARPANIIRDANGTVLDVEVGALGGYEIEEIYANFAAELANVVAAGVQNRTVMVVSGGTNSIPSPGDGGDGITNVTWHLKLMLSQAADAGVQAYACTITPRSGQATFVDGVNAIMLDGGWPMVNVWSVTVNDAGTALASQCGQADAVHLSDGGSAAYTWKICDTIRMHDGRRVCTVPQVTCQ